MAVLLIRHRATPGHVHCRLFISSRPYGTFAMCGGFTVRTDEFQSLRDAMSGVRFEPETEATLAAMAGATGPVRVALELPAASAARIGDLQATCGASMREIIENALRLYEAAVEAREAGNEVLVRDRDGVETAVFGETKTEEARPPMADRFIGYIFLIGFLGVGLALEAVAVMDAMTTPGAPVLGVALDATIGALALLLAWRASREVRGRPKC